MKLSRTLRMLPAVGVIALAACQDGEPTAPFLDPETLALEDVIALDVLTSPGAIEAAVALADVPVTAMSRMGGMGGMGFGARNAAANDVTQARLRYQEAAHALQAGDTARALERVREARRLVVGAARAAGGARMAASMVERLEALADDVARNPGAYMDPAGLHGELTMLAAGARTRMQQRDSTGAMERAVVGEQRHRQRHRPPGTGDLSAELHVELGAAAVALATRLLEDGATEEQLRWLEMAVEYQREAEAALEAGEDARAAHLAGLANWSALKAVVLPGGITAEEARAMLELAESLYAEAAAAELSEFEAGLLARARALIDAGAQALEQGAIRGVGPLWHAAVICSWIGG